MNFFLLMGRLTPLSLEGRLTLSVWGMFIFPFFKVHVCLSTRSLVSLWWIRVQCSQFGSQAVKGWKPVVNWVVPMTESSFKEASWKDKRSCIHSFGAPKVDTLLDLPGHDMFIDPSLVLMKMLNVDTTNWMCLHQTCHFIGVMCISSTSPSLSPTILQNVSPTVVIGTLPSHSKVNVSARIPSNPWVVPWLQPSNKKRETDPRMVDSKKDEKKTTLLGNSQHGWSLFLLQEKFAIYVITLTYFYRSGFKHPGRWSKTCQRPKAMWWRSHLRPKKTE